MKKKNAIPTKTTLNLMIRQRSGASPLKVIPLLLIILLGVGAFSRFAVIGRLAELERQQAVVAQGEAALAQIQASYPDYTQVQEQYRRYSYGSFSESELATVDRMAVLDLLDAKIAPAATVKDLSVSGAYVSLRLEDITLEESSALISDLLTSPIVADVSVYSAGYGAADANGSRPMATAMNITLTSQPEGGEG